MTIEEIIQREEETAKQEAREADRMRNKGMTAIADWRKQQWQYHMTIVDLMKELQARRLTELEEV